MMRSYSPQPPLELEDHLETGEAPGGVVGGAVRRVVLDQLQLGQLDALVHHQGSVDLREPLEHQVLRSVGHWNTQLSKEASSPQQVSVDSAGLGWWVEY